MQNKSGILICNSRRLSKKGLGQTGQGFPRATFKRHKPSFPFRWSVVIQLLLKTKGNKQVRACVCRYEEFEGGILDSGYSNGQDGPKV